MAHKKHYHSIQDLYRDTEAQARPHAEYSERTMLYWHGVENAEDIFTYAKTGWTDGVRRTTEALKCLGIPRISSFHRQRRQGDFGDYIDMQRIYSGDVARAWTKTVRVQDKAHRQLAPVTLFAAVLGAEEPIDRDKEHFWTVGLTNAHHVKYVELVSLGTLNQSLVHPREVFRMAIAEGVASIILGHNHPSGNVEPSPEDCTITRRLADCGELLGIKVLDHVIIGQTSGEYVSMTAKGIL
ncbi:MAG: JAB domain-containing protein [Planctomycetota bacterium]